MNPVRTKKIAGLAAAATLALGGTAAGIASASHGADDPPGHEHHGHHHHGHHGHHHEAGDDHGGRHHEPGDDHGGDD